MKTLEYNLQTLFDNNFVLKKRIIGNYNRKTVCLFRNTNKSLGGNLLKDIIDFCGTILKNNIRLPVVIYLGEIKVEDKLSYILLECIAHQLIINGFDLQIIMYPSFSIDTQGVTFSPLRFLNPYYVYYEKSDKTKRKNQFLKSFELTQSGKYRKWLSKDDEFGVSKLTTDLIYLFRSQYHKHFSNYTLTDYEEVIVKKLATTIGELVDNAHEHGESNCLIDIDFSHDFTDKRENNKTFGGVNVTIINFSNRNFEEKVKHKILYSNIIESSRYLKVREAFNIHKELFNKKYTEDIFWFIASLQDKISGRDLYVRNGGKGSTELTSSIQEFTHDDYCYVMSGKNIINLKKKYLESDSDGFVGFNGKNFISCEPDPESYSKSKVYFPGVAYNLNFVLEECNDEKN